MLYFGVKSLPQTCFCIKFVPNSVSNVFTFNFFSASQTKSTILIVNPILMVNVFRITKDPLAQYKVTYGVTECATLAMLLHQQNVMISIQAKIFFVASLISHPSSPSSHLSSQKLFDERIKRLGIKDYIRLKNAVV